MPIIADEKLYNEVKKEADQIYKKSSAYKSGYIVKKYKELGGKYIDDNQPKNLERWFKEQWSDVGNKEYPVYRPTKRINEYTPLTVDEIDPINLQQQIKLKQKIKGDSNLPPFKQLIPANKIEKDDELYLYSNPKIAQKMAYKYLGNDAKLYKSTNPKKKYMIMNPNNNKWVHFGQMFFEDATKHKDMVRIIKFKNRNKKWANSEPYTASFLSYYLLW